MGGRDAISNLTNAELYDPATDTWSAGGVLTTARIFHRTTLLPNGQVLVAGGDDDAGFLTSTELYDPGLGFDSASRPVITTVSSPVKSMVPFSITGTGFRGVGNTEASSGGYNSSATNYPLAQIRSTGNEQLQWLVPQEFSATAYTGTIGSGFPAGPAWITFFVNGIPSISQYVQVRGKSKFPWPMFLPAITGNSQL